MGLVLSHVEGPPKKLLVQKQPNSGPKNPMITRGDFYTIDYYTWSFPYKSGVISLIDPSQLRGFIGQKILLFFDLLWKNFDSPQLGHWRGFPQS